MHHCLIDSSLELKQSTQVDMGISVIRVEAERSEIGVPSRARVGVLDVVAEVEPLCGGELHPRLPCRAIKAASH
jgi:hypothetical protein